MQYKIDLTKTPKQILFDLFNNDNDGTYTIDQFSFSNPLEYEGPAINGRVYEDTATLTALVPMADINTADIYYDRVSLSKLFSNAPLKLLSFYLKPDIDFDGAANEISKIYGLNVTEGFEIVLVGDEYYLQATADNVVYKDRTTITQLASFAERVNAVELNGFFGKKDDKPPVVVSINPPSFKLQKLPVANKVNNMLGVKDGFVTVNTQGPQVKLELRDSPSGSVRSTIDLPNALASGYGITNIPRTNTLYLASETGMHSGQQSNRTFMLNFDDGSTKETLRHPHSNSGTMPTLFATVDNVYSFGKNSPLFKIGGVGMPSSGKYPECIANVGDVDSGFGFAEYIVLTGKGTISIYSPTYELLKQVNGDAFLLGGDEVNGNIIYFKYGYSNKTKVYAFNLESKAETDITDTVPNSFIVSDAFRYFKGSNNPKLHIAKHNTYLSREISNDATSYQWYLSSVPTHPFEIITKPSYRLEQLSTEAEITRLTQDDYGYHTLQTDGDTTYYGLSTNLYVYSFVNRAQVDAHNQQIGNLFARDGHAYWTRDDMQDRGGYKYLIDINSADGTVNTSALHIACSTIEFLDRGYDVVAIKDGKAYNFDTKTLSFSDELYVGTDLSKLHNPLVLGDYIICGNNAEKHVFKLADLSLVGTISRGDKHQGEWAEISLCGYDSETATISILKSTNSGATVYGLDTYKLSDLTKETHDELLDSDSNLRSEGVNVYKGKFKLMDGQLVMFGEWDTLYSLYK